MGFDDLATKDDIKRIENLISTLSSAIPPKQDFDKTGLTTKQVIQAFGGEVSDNFVDSLRKDKVIHGKKIGGLWIYNYRSVMDCIPEYTQKEK